MIQVPVDTIIFTDFFSIFFLFSDFFPLCFPDVVKSMFTGKGMAKVHVLMYPGSVNPDYRQTLWLAEAIKHNLT